MPSNAADPNVPVGVDTTRASVARVYDYLLGGKDNYDIDRQTAEQMAAALPDVVEVARENRAFLIRAIRFIVTQTPVTQFLDCGSGLPTAENVHQVAQRIKPDTRVVYVDNDPVVTAHGRALLQTDERSRYIEGDIFDPRSILDHDTVRSHLDWTEPIALSQAATLHHHKGDRDAPAAVMRAYIDALPSGSYVIISHLFDPESEDTKVMRQLKDAVARGSLGGATWRTHSEINELFAGLELLEPGIVPLIQWWPDGPASRPSSVAHRIIAGGIGRKP